MLLLVRQLIRAGTIAFAILLVLLATTGFHLHADHDDHDHHHHHMGADHGHDHADETDHGDPIGGDPVGGENGADTDVHDGILFHSHGVLADVMSPQLVLALGADYYASTANYRPYCDAAPDHPARDIDPPPNKRVL